MKIDNVKLKIGENESQLKRKAIELSGIKNPSYFRILKKSIDARDKGNIHFVYSVEIDKDAPTPAQIISKKYKKPEKKVLVVGAGPAGLFASLILARNGFNPLLIERGESVTDRKKSIDLFEKTGKLNVQSNVQFGEGGAGTFSDGKLNTGVKSEFKAFVLSEFVKHGAPACIEYDAKPHIGSDKLPLVVKSIREEIINCGGSVRFNARLENVEIKDDTVVSATVNGEKIEVSEIVLAIGHSARDTYESLFNAGFFMEPKDCAVGLRVEHLQENINKAQYGKNYLEPSLGSADYKLTSRASERGVFTFCMCPGGFVTAATSEEKSVVTNGYSNFARDGKNANSAVVVQIKKEDYGNGVLAGIEYLRKLEQLAFREGGENYSAPCQLVGDFLNGTESKSFGEVKPTYPLGTNFCRLDKMLPDYIVQPLKKGIIDMDRRLKGFADKHAVLTGVETRTSTPVRITRTEKLSSVKFTNAYPAGETGYAGGIMSAALDGIKVANAILSKYE